MNTSSDSEQTLEHFLLVLREEATQQPAEGADVPTELLVELLRDLVASPEPQKLAAWLERAYQD